MIKFEAMPETDIDGSDGSVRISQKQDGEDVLIWFPVEMAASIVKAIEEVAKKAHEPSGAQTD